jgi:NRPS condensation-like uncharacterized protein
VLTSRLNYAGRRAGERWDFCPDPAAASRFDVIDMGTADETQVAERAEQILNEDIDPMANDPVEFRLIRGADADMFLLQWNHVLMDGKAGDFLLRELHREFLQKGGESASPDATGDIQRYLNTFPWRRQLSGFVRFVKNHRPRGEPVSLFPQGTRHFDPQRTEIKLLTQTLSIEQTDAFMARTRRVCGFPNPAPALLASAFRAARELTTQPVTARSVFYTLIPLNLRPPTSADPLFCNYMTYVRARVEARELDDRNQLVKILQTQMRDQLREGADLGFLRGFVLMSRLPRWIVDWAQRRVFRLASFVYGYHGNSAGLDSFCEQKVDRLIGGIPVVSSPPGLVSDLRGR